MVYHDKVLKQEAITNEYEQVESNMITTSSQNRQEQSNMETIEFMVDYRKKEIKVSLEFPKATDSKAAQNFETLLKEIYLRKIELLSMQKKESALHCQSQEKKEETKDEA